MNRASMINSALPHVGRLDLMNLESIDKSSLSNLKKQLHEKILMLRSLESVINKPKFSRLWHESTDEEKKQVSNYIDNKDKDSLLNWLNTHRALEVGELNIRQLRETAKQMNIRNYSRLGKLDLMRAINGEKQSGNAGGDEVPGGTDETHHDNGEAGTE